MLAGVFGGKQERKAMDYQWCVWEGVIVIANLGFQHDTPG